MKHLLLGVHTNHANLNLINRTGFMNLKKFLRDLIFSRPRDGSYWLLGTQFSSTDLSRSSAFCAL